MRIHESPGAGDASHQMLELIRGFSWFCVTKVGMVRRVDIDNFACQYRVNEIRERLGGAAGGMYIADRMEQRNLRFVILGLKIENSENLTLW